MRRERRPELMDQPQPDPAELIRSLDDLRQVNRWLGGTRAVLRVLGPLLRRHADRPQRVLDVATGSGDIPLALTRWARARGVRLHVVAVDFHPQTLALARERTAHDSDVQVLHANALSLPFADGAFDIAMCCTALHHFESSAAVTVLRELHRVSRRAVVVSDLLRSPLALLGAQLLAATWWRRHPITRHDGPHSVRAAFTPAELRALAAEAGLPAARVSTQAGIRLSLVSERSAGPSAR